MNEVGGSESGTGLRAIKSSRTSDANFEYDDSEWDVGIGNLIIDLDADIEKNNEANRNNNNSSTLSGTSSIGGSVSSNNLQQMHIPLTSSSGSNSNNKSGKTSGSGNTSLTKGSNSNSTTSSNDLSSVMEHSSVVDKGLKMKIKRTKTGTKSGADAKHEIVKNDVVGTSNGTTGGNSSSNSSYSSNKSISDSISTKNSHSSHKDKDKLLIKDGLLHDNSHDSSGSINNATTGKDGEHGGGGKVKTPRKGSTKEKKTKNSGNVGNSGNSKKDEKNNESNSKSLSNSGSGNSNTGSSGTHAKDNKEFFSTTVNLNVPNVIPNSSSSAFVKTTATIKVPSAPSSNSSVLSSSTNSGLHNVHASGGDSSSSTSRSQSLSSNNSSAGNNSSTPWGTVSPTKGADKGRLSPSVANLSNATEKSSGNSYTKKGRAFAASDKSGSNQDENSSGSQGSSSSNSSYRNQGALANSATDLSSSSPNFVQGGTGTQSGNGGSFGSPKDSGKGGRNTTPTTQDVCIGTSVGTVTEPDCLGPCEPGTSVTLEGIVWHETESGVLVVNVTWRGKTYVGTLIDCTKNDWAPPRFCDSPCSSDLEMRTPKNRGKRGRAQAATPVNEPVVPDSRSTNAKLRNGAKGRRGSNTATAFVAPASPVKPDPWPKRKTRGSENENQEETNPKNTKRLKVTKDNARQERRSNSPAADNEKSGPSSPQLIECPEPNCSKKYTHMNGLRYHLNHAHSNNFVAQEDSDSNLSTASTTNTPAQADPQTNSSSNDTIEPMMVDGPEISESSNSSTKNASSNSIPDEPVSTPPTPGKKNSNAPASTTTPSSSSATTTTTTTTASKVDDKIYDLSSDADLNPTKDSNQDNIPEPYSKSVKGAANNKSQPQGKDTNSDSDSKLVPENLSKDSSTTSSSSSSSSTSSSASSASTTPTTSAPTLTPRTPILTVPVVPSYMSLQNRNLVHGHVVNVPRVEPRESSDNSCSPMKNSSSSQGSAPVSKNAPWQPHAQTGLSPHVMNTSPPTQSINVPLNIPMNISEKLGGGSSSKDKDKNGNSPDQASSKKNKHKKKSKDRDRERDGKSKDKDKLDMSNKGLNIPVPGGPSDYSRSSGMFHNSGMGSDRSKEMGSGDDTEMSRKNSQDNREDPQSPAYSDISDANDSGPDAELNVGGSIKDPACKNLVIPGEIKKDPVGVVGVPGAPPYQFFNHNLHSPYLDSLSYSASRQQNKEGVPAVPGNVPEDSDKNRPSGPINKHPSLPPSSQVPTSSAVVGSGSSGDPDARRSPKMDFSKYPYPNYFSYPYSGYHPYENNPFANSLPPSENSFNNPGQGRMFPGMEEREKDGTPGSGKGDKHGDKDDIPSNVQIKQEPIEREERNISSNRKDSRSQSMNIGDDKNVEVKREFGSDRDHNEPKLVPPYMINSSTKHKEHSSKRDDRHESRSRHEGKDLDAKSEKSSRNSSSSNMEKNRSSEDSEPKERKDEGAKPTMETTGPPPPPTASAYYLAQSYLPSNPFGIPFDPSHPLYRQMLVPGPYPGSPYIHPGSLPRFGSPGGATPLPEDLSRPNPGGPPGNPSKALDLLQHHAAQYYSSHKIHELQERALKSPSPQVAASQRAERDGPSSGPGGPPSASSPGGHPLAGGPGSVPHSVGGGRSSMGGASASGSMPKPADLSKDTKPILGPGGTLIPGGPNSDNVRTPPPTQHHVHSHTHHHTHVGIGYPIIPTVPPQYSPHYGVLATPPAAASVIPPFPAQKPN